MNKNTILRDLAIEAAIKRLAIAFDPSATLKEMDKRCEMIIHEGSYTVEYDGKALMHVNLEGSDDKFTISILRGYEDE